MAEAGARFEKYVRGAMSEGDIASMAELARRSGIAASVWHTWFRGEKQPRRTSLTLAGQALGRTPEQLAAVWDGERPHKPRRATESDDPTAAAIDRQTAVLAELAAYLRPLAEAVEALLRVEERSTHDEPGDEARGAPRVPHGTMG